jgi:hypothetical protein
MHRTLRRSALLLLAAAVPAGAQEPIAVGQTAAGELSGADVWRFTARPGATYMITLRSQDFDAYLQVGQVAQGECDPCRTNDDADGSDARVVLGAEAGGARFIHVSASEAGESGRYTLALDEVEPLPSPGGEPSPASRGGGVLHPGVAATGVLDEGDRRAPYNPLTQNSLYDVWTYRGSAGETLTLSLTSDFDPFVRIYEWDEDRWQRLGSSDDYEQVRTRGSKVVVTLLSDGEYQVHAAALYERAAGPYTLTLSSTPATDSVTTAFVTDFVTDFAAVASPDDPPFIVPGGSMAGELSAGDSVAEDGTFYDAYRYYASTDTAAFQLLSEAFGGVLRIGVREDGVWREVARDDGGPGPRRQLAVVLPGQATYELRVGTHDAGRTGAYVLFADAGIANDASARLPETTIVAGQTLDGRLEPGDPPGMTGAFEDVWTLVAEGLTTIDLRSGDFDPLLEVQARPAGGTWIPVAGNDDGGAGTDSRLTYSLSPDQQYRIHVTTHRRGEGGAYTLAVSRAEEYDAGAPPSPIAPGQAVSGRLADTDSRDAEGSYRDEWTFRGRAGETVTITLRSDDFNALVQVGQVVNGEWQLLKEEDGTVDTRDAVLVIPLPEAGEYRIRAGSHRPGETGAYTLTLEGGRFF